LAFALWELAARPELNDPTLTAAVVREAQRLYPAGWIGSRVTARPVEVDGGHIPPGRMVLYSPYLTHRDPCPKGPCGPNGPCGPPNIAPHLRPARSA
jgi:cytochrome P450